MKVKNNSIMFTSNKHLVIIDLQNDFVSGSLGSEDAKKIVPKVREVLEDRIKNGYSITATLDTHSNKYLETFEGKNLPIPHCIQGTEGHQIVNEVRELLNTIPHLELEKCTFGTIDISTLIKDGDDIEICGLCTDICVISNALILRAHCPNSKIVCLSECCAGTSKEAHEAALNVMKSCQIEVI